VIADLPLNSDPNVYLLVCIFSFNFPYSFSAYLSWSNIVIVFPYNWHLIETHGVGDSTPNLVIPARKLSQLNAELLSYPAVNEKMKALIFEISPGNWIKGSK
jgi:hypothetical protein